MSDFMALLMNRQNERELEMSLERRRLQREAAALAEPSRRRPTRIHRNWFGLTRPSGSLGRSARAH